MERNQAVTQVENGLRNELTSLVGEAEMYLTPEGAAAPNLRVAGLALKKFDEKLPALQDRTFTRIGTIQSEAAQRQATREWVQFKCQVMELYEAQYQALQSLDDTRVDPAVVKTQKVNAVKEKINSLATQIADLTELVQTDITDQNVDGFQMPRHSYDGYMKRLDEIKLMIRPGLSDLHEELLQLDMAQANATQQSLSEKIKTADADFNRVINSLHRVDIKESTFEIPAGPQAHSTGNTSILGAASSTFRSLGSRSTFRHTSEPIPTFDGCPADYPLWKEELQMDVLPGESDARCVRIMAQKCPIKNLYKMFKKQADAWDYLDQLYADSVAGSDEAIKGFLALKSVKGNSDQQRLLSLYETLRTLERTLDALNRKSRLTESDTLIAHALDLLPSKYKEDFALDRVEKTERDHPNGEMPAKDLYDLLISWLTRKNKIITSCGLARPIIPSEDDQQSLGDDTSQYPPPTADRLAKLRKRWATFGPCPYCKAEGHMFWGRKGWAPSSNLSNCDKWVEESLDQRVEFVLRNDICSQCLSWTHSTDLCERTSDDWGCPVVDPGQTQPCNAMHSKWLHGTTREL